MIPGVSGLFGMGVGCFHPESLSVEVTVVNLIRLHGRGQKEKTTRFPGGCVVRLEEQRVVSENKTMNQLGEPFKAAIVPFGENKAVLLLLKNRGELTPDEARNIRLRMEALGYGIQ